MAQSSTKTTSNGNGNATTHLHHQQAQQQQQQQKVRKVLVENRGTGHLVQYNQRSSISSISTVSANSSSSISSSSSGSSGSSSGSRSNNREKEAVVAGSGATPQQPQHQHQQHRPQQQPRTVASVNIRKKHQSERANNNHSLASRRPANLDLRPVKNSLPKSASLPSVIPRHGILKSSSDSSSPQRKPQQAPTKCRSFSSLLQQLRHPSRKSASCSRIYDPTTAAATAVAPLIAVRHSSNESSPVSPYKSVSFSPDTSFVSASEARPSQKRKQQAKLHSCAGYRQGVLADDERLCNLPSSWEEALGGPKALLIAAQDADDDVVRRIVNLVGKAGLGDIDVNARDPSGRTAISYMAGNGSALVLEACLGFPGADANLPDNEANTPLHFAAQAGQTECVNILLQRCPSIEVDARNSLGFTPLMKAALQGRTKCAKILLFAGANPTLRDHGRGFRAEQWARFCGRYVCAEVIERFARHRLLEKSSSCRWGSEPELAAQILQGKFMAMPPPPQPVQHHGTGGSLKSKFRRVFRTASNSERSTGGGHGSGHGGFSLVSQLTSAALCASSPVLPKSSDVSPVVKSLLRPLSVPQLRVTLVAQDAVEIDRIDAQLQQQQQQQQSTTVVKPARTKKKNSNNST